VTERVRETGPAIQIGTVKGTIMSKWQDFSTAPKDGIGVILACREGHDVFTCEWRNDYEDTLHDYKNGWYWFDNNGTALMGEYMPTHWMPMPDGPGVEPSESTPLPDLTRLAALANQLPTSLRADWDGTNHYELTSKDDSNYWWLMVGEGVRGIVSEECPCDTEHGKRLGLIMDIAAEVARLRDEGGFENLNKKEAS